MPAPQMAAAAALVSTLPAADDAAVVEKLSRALRLACGGVTEEHKDKLVGAPSLNLIFSETRTTWTVAWDAASREASLRTDAEDPGGIVVRTARETLVALASKRLSPFSALAGGKIKCDLRGNDREGAVCWMPVLVRVGG